MGGITAMTTIIASEDHKKNLYLKIIKKWAWMEALLFSGVNGSLAFPIKRFVAAVDDLRGLILWRLLNPNKKLETC